jgi:nucleotide-binding universal stress UspA family protein
LKRILLILAPSRISSTCIDEAIEEAKRRGAELTALFVLDTAISEDVQARLQDAGFLGETPSGQLIEAMRREQERQGRGELGRIEELARTRGIPITTRLVVGEFLRASLEAANQESPEAIFVARRDRSRLSRLVGGSPVNELKSTAPCAVLVHAGGRSEDQGR